MKSSNMASPFPRKTPKKTPRKPSKPKLKDPVEVYCRIRPLNDNDEDTCVEVINSNTIQLTPPLTSQGFKSGHRVTATQHTFKEVFNEDASQKTVFDTVALPLVHDLIHGKNGLIFAYGITGSGKTHTMTGEPSNGGLLPRALDVLFNSIAEFQTKRCVFTPDKSNGMDVQSEYDAKCDYDRKQKEMAILNTLGKNRSNDDDITDMVRVPDCTKFDDVDEDNGFAAFVSYVEIYNNFIYDLLEDSKQDAICPKPPVSKNLREDNTRNMYVQGVTEVEVKSTEEAYAMFWKGQKKRRVANTQLNMQSSRSHSVFTIKLVQAPLDPEGESVLLEKDEISVNTLSLCDLAGSERTNRTKSDGERLREAGNINKDLMTLRSCLEILRENQANADNGQTAKMVPYRDGKLTHLFKNFFDGEGKVRMVVCLNPSATEYDESVHVMRFAEITQEVVVARPSGISSNAALAPGRRKANQIYKQALENISEDANDGVNPLFFKPLATFPPFPLMELTSPDDSITLVHLLKYLQDREKRRATLEKELDRKKAAFRQELLKLDSNSYDKEKVIAELKASNIEKDKEIQKLERRLKAVTQRNDALLRVNHQHEENAKGLQTELDEQRKKISQEKQDKVKLKQALKGAVSQEKNKWEKECDKRVKDKQHEMETKIFQSEEKLRQLKEIVYKDSKNDRKSVKTGRTKGFFRSRSPPPVAKKPTVKLRHRRSRSTDYWLEHKPAENYETETILRPVLKKKKTVQVPEEKHFKGSQATNYVLEHQEADSQGELETKLIKGDVYKTTGGGHCVQFTDIETLKTNFEVARSPERKRGHPEEEADEAKEVIECDSSASWTDVETRCAFGIEGRPGQADPSIHHNAKRRKSKE